MTASPTHPPLTDSPWFWLALFGTAALVGLVAINPKFSRRQQRLDRQFQVRQEVWERKVEGAVATAGPSDETPLEERYGRLIFLSPLVWIGVPAVAALWWQVWRRRRRFAAMEGPPA